MKFIKEYNHVSDIIDIKDIFREYADKYDLSFNKTGENWSIWNDDFLNSYYFIENKKIIYLVILFDDYFGSAGVDGYLGEEFQKDIGKFQKRLIRIGYESKIDWSGGSVYTIEINI